MLTTNPAWQLGVVRKLWKPVNTEHQSNKAMIVYSSESETTVGRGEEKKRKARSKRRKTVDKSPCVTILSVEEEEVECLLELPNRNAVTFKFALEIDKPEEIAESLVRSAKIEKLCKTSLLMIIKVSFAKH